MPRARPKPLTYDVHPGVQMVQNWIATLHDTSGRSLDQWVALIQAQRFPTIPGARAWLKATHAVGGNTATYLATRALGGDLSLADEDPDHYLACAPVYVDRMYAAKRAYLRPLHDRLHALARSIAGDVRVCPCTTIVPIFRRHVIAQIKPATNTRIDLGLALANHKGRLPKRLIDTGGLAKKDRITHRIEIATDADIDDDVRHWLQTAYDLDAPAPTPNSPKPAAKKPKAAKPRP